MLKKRTNVGYLITTKQKTFAASEREDLDSDVNAFLEQLSSNNKVIGFDLSSHGVAIADTTGNYCMLYTTTLVWQEYAE